MTQSDHFGSVVGTAASAAMNLSAHTSRGPTETIRRELLRALRGTAGLVEGDLHAVFAATRPLPTA